MWNGHDKSVNSAVITSDSKYVITGSSDRRVIIWNLQDRIKEYILSGHNSSIKTISLSNSEKYIISADTDNTVRVWRIHRK